MKLWTGVRSLAILLSFLTCVLLIYCSRGVVLILAEGHHEDVPQDVVRNSMLVAAAIVAPASVYLTAALGCGWTILAGTSCSILGLMLPCFIATPLTRVVAFTVLQGTGLSMTFQANIRAMSSILNSSRFLWPVILLSLSAVTMTTTVHYIMKLAVNNFIRILIGLMFVGGVLPATLMIWVSKLYHRHTDRDMADEDERLLDVSCGENRVPDEKEDTLLLNIQPSYRDVFTITSTPNQTKTEASIRPTVYSDFQSRACVILWWATGIDLSLIIAYTGYYDLRSSALMCAASLFTFITHMKQKRKTSDHRSDNQPEERTSYLLVGLLGLSGFIQYFNVIHADIFHHHFLYTIGFVHLLDDYVNIVSGTQYKHQNISYQRNENVVAHGHTSMHQQDSHFSLDSLLWIINEFCIEMVFSFFAILFGFLFTYPLTWIFQTSMIFDTLLSDTAFILLTVVSILLSFHRSRPVRAYPASTLVS